MDNDPEPVPQDLGAAQQEVRRLRDENERLRLLVASDYRLPFRRVPELLAAAAEAMRRPGVTPADLVGALDGALRRRLFGREGVSLGG